MVGILQRILKLYHKNNTVSIQSIIYNYIVTFFPASSVASEKPAADNMPNLWVESDDKEETEECTKSWEDSGVGTLLCRNLHMEQLP